MSTLISTIQWPRALSAMRHRNFRLFFVGQLVSVVGTWMQSTAQQWLVYRITGSQTSLGMVTFIGFLPVLLLSLFMGVLVDRVSRRRLLIFTQTWFMLLAVVLAVLTATGVVQYWHILILAGLLGIGNALDMPARQTFVVELVDQDKGDVMNAIGLNSSLFNLARIVGPAVGGAVVAALGEAPAFAINAVTFLAVIAALLLMRLQTVTTETNQHRPWENLLYGFRYMKRTRRVLGLVVMVAAFSMVGFGALTLLPVFAKDILKIGVKGFGQLLSVQGVGALIGALLLVVAEERFHKGRTLLFSRALIGLAIGGLALSRIPWVSMLILGIAGYAFITQLILTNTLIQTIVPDDLRGRVLSTYTWAIGGFYPLGALLMGFLGDQLGAPTAAMISAAGCAVLVGINLAFFPKMQQLQ
ncbi:MAG: MFS transporter [Anaerolineales bacterium]|nr:MFS transporter [Anaerolineales bacterium]